MAGMSYAGCDSCRMAAEVCLCCAALVMVQAAGVDWAEPMTAVKAHSILEEARWAAIAGPAVVSNTAAEG